MGYAVKNFDEQVRYAKEQIGGLEKEIGKEIGGVEQKINEVEQKINEVEQKINEVEQKINEVKQKIKEVEQEIKEVKEQIKRLEGEIKACSDPQERAQLRAEKAQLRDKEAQLRDKEAQLRDEEAQLRDEEAQLRDEKAQLRDKKALLLEKIQPGRESGAMVFDYLDKRIREIVVENMPIKRPRRGTAFTTVAVGDVAEEALWKAEVQEACVPCVIVDVDELLVPERALVADLRYLQLQLVGRTTSLYKVVKMKRQRLKQAHDLERDYYSPALTIMQASVAGQQEVQAVSEDHTAADGARGDLRLYVNNEECPSEMKAVNGSSNLSADPDGIHSNKAAFGKLLKIIRTKLVRGNTGSQTFICTFWNRIECIWFVKFEFEANGLKEVLVAPQIPAKGLLPPAPICDDLDSILDLCIEDRIKDEDVMLSHLLGPQVPLGFRYLTRYIDTLCDLKGVPINDVVFKTYNGDIIDMREARIIARGGKSLILQVGEEHAVIKVGPRECIDLEYSNHKLVDGHVENIRCMVDGVHGVVEGVEKLGFIKLQGLGRRICVIPWEKLEEYWTAMETALSGLHRMGLLHRDVKPENMLLIDEQLVLHDFDVSCPSNDSSRLSEYVGTENFRSPFWEKGDQFIPADDWVSLGLSFVSLLKLPPGMPRDSLPLGYSLLKLLSHPRLPKGMREKLNAAMESSNARGETVRDPSHCTE